MFLSLSSLSLLFETVILNSGKNVFIIVLWRDAFCAPSQWSRRGEEAYGGSSFAPEGGPLSDLAIYLVYISVFEINFKRAERGDLSERIISDVPQDPGGCSYWRKEEESSGPNGSKERSRIEIPLRRYSYVTIVLISANFREITMGKTGRRNDQPSPRLQTEERRCIWRRTRIRPGQSKTSDLPRKYNHPGYRQRWILAPIERQPAIQQDETWEDGEYRPLLIENRQDARKIGARLEGLTEHLSQVTVRRATIA